jgi:hypothetical protein
VAERSDDEARGRLERNLASIKAPPDRIDRLKALLSREASMLQLIGKVHEEVEEIHRRRMDEQKEEGF